MDGLKKNFKPILLFTGDIVRPMDESKIPAHQYCQNFAEYVKSISATKAEEKSSDEESPDDEEKSSDEESDDKLSTLRDQVSQLEQNYASNTSALKEKLTRANAELSLLRTQIKTKETEAGTLQLQSQTLAKQLADSNARITQLQAELDQSKIAEAAANLRAATAEQALAQGRHTEMTGKRKRSDPDTSFGQRLGSAIRQLIT